MSVRCVTLLFGALLALSGCAGAHYRVSGDGLGYPVSFSRVVHDADGRPLFLGEALEPVGQFVFRKTSVGFLYGVTGTTVDLSDDINREVARFHGEAVVSLRMRTENCSTSWLFPLTALPFYPGCQNLAVSGTVVTRTRAAERAGGSQR